jgi:hypothetical protein
MIQFARASDLRLAELESVLCTQLAHEDNWHDACSFHEMR